nr:ABC transporter C family member 3-like [Tanacetum cinerariifolium]
MCFLNFFYWYRNGRTDESFNAVKDTFVGTFVWLVVSVYVHTHVSDSTESMYSSVLRVWWVSFFSISCFSLVLDYVDYTQNQYFVAQFVVFDALSALFGLLLCYFGLSGKSDSNEGETINHSYKKLETVGPSITPSATRSVFSLLTFSWIQPLIAKGYKKPLDLEDIPELDSGDSASGACSILRSKLESYKKENSGITTYGLVKAVIWTTWKDILITALLSLVLTLASYVGPFLIDTFIEYLNGHRDSKQGLLLVSAFSVANIVACLAQQHRDFRLVQVGIRAKAALVATIYFKSLTLSAQSKQGQSNGEIVNFMAVDAERILNFSRFMHNTWLIVVQVSLGLAILYTNLGLSSLTAFVAIIMVVSANIPLGSLQGKFQRELMKYKDKRMKATSEILNNMRILKLHGWEMKFLLRIENIRNEESHWLYKFVFTMTMSAFVFWIAPTFVAIATFVTCILLDSDSVEMVPRGSSNTAVEIIDGNFSWDVTSSTPTLSNIHLRVVHGMRVAVCGVVGSGKSSLLSSTSEILNNMRILKLHGWEMKFLLRIENIRNEESHWLYKFVFTMTMSAFVFWIAPTFVAIATFVTCILLGKVLSALATFKNLQESAYNLPSTISKIAQTKVSLDRIASFLSLQELDSDLVETVPRGKVLSALATFKNLQESAYNLPSTISKIAQTKVSLDRIASFLSLQELDSDLVETVPRECLAQRHCDFKKQEVGIRVRASLVAMIYHKGLTLSSQSKQRHSNGEIINFMAVDAERIGDFSTCMHNPWLVIVQVGLALAILYKILGVSSLATFVTTIIIVLSNIPLGRFQETFQRKLMIHKDKRMKTTSEILKNMRILKLYGWEMKFLSRINDFRNDEAHWLYKYMFTMTMTAFAFWVAPTFVAVATFGSCMLAGVPLDSGKVLSALATFKNLQESAYNLPSTISKIAQTKVSLDRIASFLSLQELDSDLVETVPRGSSDTAVEIINGNFSWDLTSIYPTLIDINFRAVHGMKVALCGAVGSGKSSLLSCILGEVPRLSGHVKLSGTKAYVGQTPWIQSGKIEENILFGKDMERERYNKVLEACDLLKDLEVLSFGDQTIIGFESDFTVASSGELSKLSGHVKLSGTKAYVGQSPWIQSGTIEENILFCKEMDIKRYNKVLEACDLKKDLEVLSFGDQTVIGERGINLSGGQKQRIQIARALYQDADIYLFDDPFSAVDAHTGSHIFRECMLGFLESKTVIYVTHQVEFLPDADLILVLKDGRIAQAGTYDNILNSGTDIIELVGAHKEALLEIDNAGKKVISDTMDVIENQGSEGTMKKQLKEETKSSQNGKKRQLVEVEERGKGKIGFSVYRKYLTTAYGGALVPLILLVHTMFEILQILSNYWMAWASPELESNEARAGDSKIIMIYVAFGIGCSFSILARLMLLMKAAYETANQLFYNMHFCIFRAPMSFFDANPSGRVLNRASADQSAVDLTIPYNIGPFSFMVIQLLGVIVVMSFGASSVFLVFFPVFGICIWLQEYYQPSARELARLVGVCSTPMIQHFSETISGSKTIRSFDQQQRFKDTYLKLIDNGSRPKLHVSALSNWLGLRVDMLSSFTFISTLIFLVYAPEGTIDPSTAGLAVTYGLFLNKLQGSVIKKYGNMETIFISVERIFQYSSIPSEPPLVIDSKRPHHFWPSHGRVDIHDLQVRYAQHMPLVLRGITCSFHGGTKTGIVGRTGSGKSTLIQTLFRIVEPTCGEILIDGINISSIGLHDLRSRLSIIPQDPTMFNGTVRSNMDPLEEYTDDQIWEALDKCHIGDEVRKKEGQLDSTVTENGENWSMGQQQLVCLGRVLLKKSRILVLDEATASVDTATDNMIQKTLRQHFSESTVITIAHRITSVISSDMVLVLNDGLIEEYDSPMKLLEGKSSSFSKLVAEYNMRSNSTHTSTNTDD